MSEATQSTGTGMVQMPSRAQFKKLSEVRTIGEAIRHPDVIDRFRSAVPKHLSPERMLRVCALAVQKTPKLAECDMMSLLGAMLGLAALGLEPNTPLGLAYLIPFEKRSKVNGTWQTVAVEIQVIIGYRGYIDLARRAGSMTSIHADVVYDGDEFTFEYGSNAHLRHVPQGVRAGRKPLWAYAHARLSDGEAFEVLPYGQVLRVRDGSQGYIAAVRGKEKNPRAFDAAPWVAHEHEMASKTMIRRISKMLPMSIDLMNAAALDAASETGNVNLRALSTAPASELMDMALLTSEDTIPAMDIGLGEMDTREREPVESPQEAPAQATRQTSKPRQQPAQVKPAPQEEPIDEFQMWPLDEIGEPVEDSFGQPMMFDDPRRFAAWFAGRIAKSDNPLALREHNMDAIVDAGSDKEALRIITEALAPLQQAATASEATREEVASPSALTVAVPTTPGGKEHWPNYAAACAGALASCNDGASVDAWVAANKRMYAGRPIEAKIEQYIRERRDVLAGKPEETDAEFVARVQREVATIETTSLMSTWAKSIRARMARLRTEAPAMFEEANAAVDARWGKINGEGTSA